jgi:hypothetical protein
MVVVDKVTGKSVHVCDHAGRKAEIDPEQWSALKPVAVGQSAILEQYESRPQWCFQRQPGELAAEWTAREWARREADDAQYVAEDEARLQSEPVDASGNYALCGDPDVTPGWVNLWVPYSELYGSPPLSPAQLNQFHLTTEFPTASHGNPAVRFSWIIEGKL